VSGYDPNGQIGHRTNVRNTIKTIQTIEAKKKEKELKI